jgi:hypothetical protein
LVHGEKKGGDREAAGDDFIPYMTIFFFFCYWGWDRGAAEVALTAAKWQPHQGNANVQTFKTVHEVDRSTAARARARLRHVFEAFRSACV